MLSRVFHTVRHLRPVQVYRRVYRSTPHLRNSPALPLRAACNSWQPHIGRPNPQITPSTFWLLNQEREVHTWNDAGVPKLWLYNLHYFDHPSRSLTERWIAENPPLEGNGWEPYPLSLRICNWIKSHLAGDSLEPEAVASLACQAHVLSQSLEHHLQANHLFVNAKALVFAGAAFDGSESLSWLRAGVEILREQLPEQVLSDGGHFERSTMYHSLILEDLLDLINLAAVFPHALSFDNVAFWTVSASRMLGWLSKLSHPDGQISFFNDAAFDIAPEPDDLRAYAGRLGIQPTDVALSESGYIRLANRRAVVLFDAASIGPDYQPGHAHADTLSFELSVAGRRQLVNSGTSTYDPGELRTTQRSTPAHNTATVDDLDSSEVWSAFRVARRARALHIHTDHSTYAEASHSGYHRLSSAVTHKRRLELEGSHLRVVDTFEGSGTHQLRVFFHLHPEADAHVALDPMLARQDEPSVWYPGFNLSIPNRRVVGSWRGRCPVSFTSTICF